MLNGYCHHEVIHEPGTEKTPKVLLTQSKLFAVKNSLEFSTSLFSEKQICSIFPH